MYALTEIRGVGRRYANLGKSNSTWDNRIARLGWTARVHRNWRGEGTGCATRGSWRLDKEASARDGMDSIRRIAFKCCVHEWAL